MGLKKGSTKWVLFLASGGEPEERHILDLAFGIYCLESANISPNDIAVYVDGKDRKLISQLIGSGTSNTYGIKFSADFFADQAQNSHENLVMFVTGHGSINGIDAQPPISPYMLLNCLKSSPKLTQAVLYLGQCHAGIFNYIGAGRNFPVAGQSGPNVIIVGATNLHDSLSSSTHEQIGVNPLNWQANLFLLHVFKWISNPIDVDGDGKYTVIDSYKYAGAMANVSNKGIKINSFVKSFELHTKWIEAQKDHQAKQDLPSQVALMAVTSQYENELSVRYTHQEGWILNAIPAQTLEF